LKRSAAIIFVLLFGIVVFAIWWTVSQSPVNPLDHSNKTFVISKGDGVREVAKKLHDQGLVRDQISFFLLVKKMGIEKNIQAGSYKISPSLNANQLAKKLTVGTEDVWITIPEGWREEEILSFLRTKNFPEGLKMSDSKFNINEGRNFPDTYLLPKTINLDEILKLMQQNFQKKVNFPVTRDQLIIASLVEREARTGTDRPIVASIIYNRLRNNMALDIDATIQYAIGYTAKDGWWKKELTTDDLKFKSPYNTYQNPGLPPGPICNPGLSSINAAVNPAQTTYYFYISDKQGHMHYAKTLEEHNINVAKYLQ
jgi:UPF0755 protein